MLVWGRLTFAPCTCGVILLSTSASTCAHGGGHWLQLALVAFYPSVIGANIPCTGGGVTGCNYFALVGFFLTPTDTHIYSTCARATCTVW